MTDEPSTFKEFLNPYWRRRLYCSLIIVAVVVVPFYLPLIFFPVGAQVMRVSIGGVGGAVGNRVEGVSNFSRELASITVDALRHPSMVVHDPRAGIIFGQLVLFLLTCFRIRSIARICLGIFHFSHKMKWRRKRLGRKYKKDLALFKFIRPK